MVVAAAKTAMADGNIKMRALWMNTGVKSISLKAGLAAVAAASAANGTAVSAATTSRLLRRGVGDEYPVGQDEGNEPLQRNQPPKRQR